MPWSVSTESLTSSLNGSASASSAEAGKLTFSPTFCDGSAGSIAMNQSEQVASSPVSGSGATIV